MRQALRWPHQADMGLKEGEGGSKLMAECVFRKPSGDRCGAPAMRDSLLCFQHNPDVAQERQRSRVKGGKSGGRGRPKGGAELVSVKAQLRQLADDVLEGKVD